MSEHKIGMKAVIALERTLHIEGQDVFDSEGCGFCRSAYAAKIIEEQTGVRELIDALKELNQRAEHLALFVVPLPTSHSNLIFALDKAQRKANEVLKKYGE